MEDSFIDLYSHKIRNKIDYGQEIVLNDTFLYSKKFQICNKIGCKDHSDLFEFKKKLPRGNKQFVYIVKRKTLSELLHCHVNENKLVSNFCENCEAFMKLLEFRLKLDDCYYYKPRTDAAFQPTRLLVYYLRDKIYMEISAVRKGKSIGWWC